MEDELLSVGVVVYPGATEGDGYTDMNKVDLSVTATIQQLRILVIFKFLQRISEYFKQFKIDQEMLEAAKASAQQGAVATVMIVTVIATVIGNIIRECDSTLSVGMPRKYNGCP